MTRLRLIEDLTPHIEDGIPKVIGIGSYVGSQNIYDRDENGNWSIKKTTGYDGYVIRLYGPYWRKRDGVLILKKIGDVQLVVTEECMYDWRVDKKLDEKAVRIAKRMAEDYEWVYYRNARHHSKIPEGYDVYVDIAMAAMMDKR